MNKLNRFISELFREICDVVWSLYKIMIPMLICVKIAEELGAISILSDWLSPLMTLLGLPEEMGLVWATTILTNIYAGLLVFMDSGASLTIAQASVLGTLLLFAHSLPLEAAITKKAGVSFSLSIIFRVVCGVVFAFVLHKLYQGLGVFEQQAQVVFQLTPTQDQSYLAWTWDQFKNLMMIFVIIAGMLLALKVMRLIGVERLLARLLKPFLKVIGISPKATNMTIIGITLGISFGGALLINEAKRGQIPKRDVFSAVMLLNLSHSMIEDTILLLLIGADFISIFWGRLIFSLVVVAIISHGLQTIEYWKIRKAI
ncbi:hypothetical protein [Vibrio caribbeanicus]|uniref:Nucleoside recognition domain-containing protein n=1 Tax=Vibrio caribbeanicus ATCC BAA-2122 TaxID=796620 RepID=E3BKK9_9VIBR|nr:hypothetical protein [Vibrio caribbeanicus]EFP96594.1 nucleoside recognition domain-containing protein [Vibrio caribbeanicus ATCC BAA-2122]